MEQHDLPILRTHVANIALNKEIALHFLLSNPQETHGLTEYSSESYINDKLLVAVWMIQQFVNFDEEDEEPWVRLPEWEIPDSSMSGFKTAEEFDEIIAKIQKESKSFVNLWDKENTKTITFLKKIVAQASECICYTNQRLTAIQILYKIGPMGQGDPDTLMSAGFKMAEKLSSNPMIMLMGYLVVKNEMNSKRILAAHLLKIILEFLVDKAVQEGYTKPPIVEPAQ